MSTYNYSIGTNFSSGLNLNKLLAEINDQIEITLSSRIRGDSLTIEFASTLSSGDQTILANIVTNHDPSESSPYSVNVTINASDTYVATHFMDPEFDRDVVIQEESMESFNDTTFTLNSTLSSNYNINNPGIAELSLSNYLLIGSGFTEGSNIATTGTASASTSTNPASRSNDGSTSNIGWYNSNSENPNGAYWQLDFGQVVGMYSAAIRWFSTSYYSTEVLIEQSSDGVNFNTVLNDTSVSYTSSGQSTGTYKFSNFSSPIFARYLRFTFNSTINSTYIVTNEVFVYQASGTGFSTSNSATINNLSGSRQIDTTNWSQINSSTIDGTFPAGTNTRILISFDNQSSWVYWNGTAWTTSSLSNITSSSMSPTTFNGLTTSNYASSGGLNSGTNTIDIAINISSNNSNQTPAINKVRFSGNTLQFQEDIKDSGTRVRYISSNKTEIKNITDTNKTYLIKIYQR